MQAIKAVYRPEIDGLRALAVVAVVLNHLDKKILPSGYLGVDIFFVISGYVITSSLLARQSESLGEFIGSFYGRRFRRLLPALIVYCIIAALLICLVDSDPGPSLRTGMAALFGFSNFHLLSLSTNYFSPDSDLNIFTQTWSLGVEEQFYFIFPFLFWILGLARRPSRQTVIRFAGLLAVLMIASWLTFRWLSAANPSAAFFLMPSRFWELSAGSLLFFLWHFGPQKCLNRCNYPMPILALLLLSLRVPYESSYNYKLTTVVVFLTGFLILNLRQRTGGFALLSYTPIVFIGLMSYSIYLWHWGIICLVRWTIGIQAWSIPFVLILTLLAGFASYQWIEKRSTKILLLTRPSRILKIGFMSSLFAFGFIFSLSQWLHTKFFMSINNTLDHSEEIDGVSLFDKCDYFRNYRTFNYARDLAACTYPANRKSGTQSNLKIPHIYYLGNSHAAHLSGMISSLRDESYYSQTILYTGAIKSPPIPKSLMLPPWDSDPWTESGIATQTKISRLILNTAKPGDVIVLGNDLGTTFAMISTDSSEIKNRKILALKTWIHELSVYAAEADLRRVQVVVMMPVPFFQVAKPDFTTKNCQKTWYRPSIASDCYLSAQRANTIQSFSGIKSSLNALEARHANLHLFSGFDVLCPADRLVCINRVKDGFTYWDGGHLNNRGSGLLSKSFQDFLVKLKK